VVTDYDKVRVEQSLLMRKIWKTFDGRVGRILHSSSQCCHLIESPGDSSRQQCCLYNLKFGTISRYSHLWRTFFLKTTRSRWKRSFRACWLAICRLQNWTFNVYYWFRSRPV